MTEEEMEKELAKVKTFADLKKISQSETELYQRAARKLDKKNELKGTSLKSAANRSAFVMNDDVKKKFPRLHATMAKSMVKKGKEESEKEQKDEEERKRKKYYKG